jgi:hypothetical protein
VFGFGLFIFLLLIILFFMYVKHIQINGNIYGLPLRDIFFRPSSLLSVISSSAFYLESFSERASSDQQKLLGGRKEVLYLCVAVLVVTPHETLSQKVAIMWVALCYVGYVVDKLALGKFSRSGHRPSLFSIIPPVLRTHILLVYHQRR